MPSPAEAFRDKILDMEEILQFLVVGQKLMAVIFHFNALLVEWNILKNIKTLLYFFFVSALFFTVRRKQTQKKL